MGQSARFTHRRQVVRLPALRSPGWHAGFDALAQAHTESRSPGGTLRIGVQGDPTNLDPHLTVLAAAGVDRPFVYEGLVTVDPDLQSGPSLAASWTVSDDLLTYTFTLRVRRDVPQRAVRWWRTMWCTASIVCRIRRSRRRRRRTPPGSPAIDGAGRRDGDDDAGRAGCVVPDQAGVVGNVDRAAGGGRRERRPLADHGRDRDRSCSDEYIPNTSLTLQPERRPTGMRRNHISTGWRS